MRYALSCCLLLTLACSSWAAPKIKGEIGYKEHEKIVLKAAELTSARAQCLWDIDGQADTVEAGDTLYVWAAPGTYRVRLTAVDFDTKKIERASFTFTVGKGPAPGPTPVPPGPLPPPGPPAALRVLVVYESAELSKLPAAQSAVLYAKSVRDYLNSKCVMGADGKTREWRIWDKDVDTSGVPAWAKLLARPRAQVPWLGIYDGDRALFEGALPADTTATLALLKKYAEPATSTKHAKGGR